MNPITEILIMIGCVAIVLIIVILIALVVDGKDNDIDDFNGCSGPWGWG